MIERIIDKLISERSLTVDEYEELLVSRTPEIQERLRQEADAIRHRVYVKDGVAYMSASSCPGHDCEKQGKARYVGQFIICAPHDINVSIIAGEDGSGTEDGVDFVS